MRHPRTQAAPAPLAEGQAAAVADHPNSVRDLQVTRRATLARLRRVNAALAAWDEHEAALARPDLFPVPEAPSVSRAALKSLQRELVAALVEQEAAWERRN